MATQTKKIQKKQILGILAIVFLLLVLFIAVKASQFQQILFPKAKYENYYQTNPNVSKFNWRRILHLETAAPYPKVQPGKPAKPTPDVPSPRFDI